MKTTFLSLLACSLLTEPVFSLGIRLPNQDPAATARGNAFAATADNASAIYYNPAGIAQMDEAEFRASAYVVEVRHEYRSNGGTIHNNEEWQAVPALYYASPIRDTRYSWGLSVNAPYGQASDWPADSPFNTLGVSAELSYLSVSPAFAMQMTDWLYLGAVVHFEKAELELEQIVPGTSIMSKTDGESTAPGLTLGALIRREAHSFGVTYRFQTIHDVDGSVDVPGIATFDYDSKLVLPDHLIVGYAYRMGQWTFEANVDWTRWSKFTELDLGLAGSIPFEWQDSFFYEVGAQWESKDGNTRLNLGYTLNENSIPDENFNPLIIDSDRHFLSAGIERNFTENWSLSATVQYGWSVDRKVDKSVGNGFQSGNGTYSTRILAFNLGVAGRF